VSACDAALAVWELPFEAVELTGGQAPSPIELVTAPLADNLNLKAQAGVFTLQRISGGLQQIPCMEDALTDFLDAIVMTKYTLPRSHARSLLRQLSRFGYDRASIFPGFSSIVQAIEDRRVLALSVAQS
jgi:hypothetical protein